MCKHVCFSFHSQEALFHESTTGLWTAAELVSRPFSTAIIAQVYSHRQAVQQYIEDMAYLFTEKLNVSAGCSGLLSLLKPYCSSYSIASSIDMAGCAALFVIVPPAGSRSIWKGTPSPLLYSSATLANPTYLPGCTRNNAHQP